MGKRVYPIKEAAELITKELIAKKVVNPSDRESYSKGWVTRIGDAIFKGDLSATREGIPIDTTGTDPTKRMRVAIAVAGSYIRADNLNKWLESAGYNVQVDEESHQVVPVPDAESAPVTSPSDSDWKEQARVIANAIGLEKWNSGIRQISARSICDAVATRLGKNQKCWGTQGPRNSNAVRSVALKGWKFIQPGGTNGTNGINE